MVARILRLFFFLSLLLAFGLQPVSGSDTPEKPYRAYLPFIAPHSMCAVVFTEPTAGKVMPPGESFDARWSIQNIGSASWQPGGAAIRFTGGERLHSGSDTRDIPYEVSPDGTLDIVIPMTSPQVPGAYASNWEIHQAEVAVCRFSLTIRVLNE